MLDDRVQFAWDLRGRLDDRVQFAWDFRGNIYIYIKVLKGGSGFSRELQNISRNIYEN